MWPSAAAAPGLARKAALAAAVSASKRGWGRNWSSVVVLLDRTEETLQRVTGWGTRPGQGRIETRPGSSPASGSRPHASGV